MIRRATERLATAAAVSGLGLVVAVALGRASVAMLVTPWFVILVLGLSRARRQHPTVSVDVDQERVMVGDEVELRVTVTGADGTVKIAPNPASRLGTLSQATPTPWSAPIEHRYPVTVPVSISADQWGSFDLGRIDMEVTESYGLMRWMGTVTDPTPVRIHPTSQQIRSMLAPWFVRRTSGSHQSRSVGRGVEYADLRQFGPGDSLRDINWRVSARTGDLWVSQRHPDRATDVVLLLDSFVESGHDVRTVFGLAIEAAVALAESHLAVTDRVGLVELGGLVRWVVPGAGRLQLHRLADTLLSTSLFTNVAERDIDMIGPRALPPRSFVLALSPLLDDRFVAALYELAGRGHDVAVIECDPSNQLPPGSDQRSRLARRIWSAERDMLRGRLSQRGVAVARWQQGVPLEATLQMLERRRRRMAPLSR